MKRDEIIVVVIAMTLMVSMFGIAKCVRDNPSDLAKKITHGVECMKFNICLEISHP